jgi:apolipoprotein N-acyltransferase
MINKQRLLSVPFLLLAAFFAWRMYALDQEQLLWGYLPLYFFASAWTGIVLASSPKKWRWLGLSTLTGVLLSLGFPPLPFTFLLFIAWIPLLMLQEEMKEESNWQVFKYAYHAFIVWNILTTYWVTNAAFIAGLFAISVNALLMSLPFVLFHWTRKRIPRLSHLAFLSFWITFEYVHLRWELSWPWLTLGNGFAQYPSWVQWYEYTGVFGGSLWILAVNVLLFRRQFWQAGLALGLPLVLSLVWYQTYTEKGDDPVEVVVVQPNYESHYEKFEVPDRDQLRRFLSLADSMVTPATQLVFFPETSFGPIQDIEIGKDPITGRLQAWVDEHPNLTLIAGLTVYHIFEPDEAHTENVRQFRRRDQTFYYESYNAATRFTAGAEDYPIYKKSKLVPGAESFPYNRLLFFLKPIVDKLDGSTAGLGTQPQRSVLSTPDGINVAPIICYESVFGEYHAGYIRKGAQIGGIITNDGWWDETAGHRQHLRFASLRAIETRRDIARSANTGISAFINQRGDVLQATQYEETAAIRGTVRPNSQITFYVLWGDMIGRISLFLSLILALNGVAKRKAAE